MSFVNTSFFALNLSLIYREIEFCFELFASYIQFAKLVNSILILVLISGEPNDAAIEQEAVDQLDDSVVYVNTAMAPMVCTPKKEDVGGRFIIISLI